MKWVGQPAAVRALPRRVTVTHRLPAAAWHCGRGASCTRPLAVRMLSPHRSPIDLRTLLLAAGTAAVLSACGGGQLTRRRCTGASHRQRQPDTERHARTSSHGQQPCPFADTCGADAPPPPARPLLRWPSAYAAHSAWAIRPASVPPRRWSHRSARRVPPTGSQPRWRWPTRATRSATATRSTRTPATPASVTFPPMQARTAGATGTRPRPCCGTSTATPPNSPINCASAPPSPCSRCWW